MFTTKTIAGHVYPTTRLTTQTILELRKGKWKMIWIKVPFQAFGGGGGISPWTASLQKCVWFCPKSLSLPPYQR